MSRHGANTVRRPAGVLAHCLPKPLGEPAIQRKLHMCKPLEHCFGRHDGALFNSLLGSSSRCNTII